MEYSRPSEAAAAVRQLDMVPLDKKHTLRINKMTDIERYGGEGRIDDKYHPPHIDEFTEKEHLRWWLKDPSGRGRDQFVMFRGETVGVYWNNERDQPENIVDRQQWTETFLQWSPLGTNLTSMHSQGVQLWGGQSWSRQARFAHPFVDLVAFSPSEKYLVTWSRREISIPDSGHPALSIDDEGKNYVIWDIATAAPLRSFANLELPPVEEGKPPAKMQWPAFKWSADEKYVARLVQGSSISVYELPRMNLLDKTSVKIDGVVDFDWAPASPQRDGIKSYEQLFCFWTPEIGSNPAKVGLMSIPSKQIVRSLNLFSVSDAKLHWQSDAAYLCVKVDRHSKSKKSQATTLEIFRIKEKGVPVEVVDTIKDTVINFAWEPRGDRFAIITTTEPVGVTAVPPKTAVSFFCPEKSKGPVAGNFKHLRTLDKKNSNAIYWSPRGRFVVIATIHNQQSSDLDFFDLDFEGEKLEAEKDLTANLQLMNTADHYGVTDLEWDPSGRFVATWASFWKHTVRLPCHEKCAGRKRLTNNRWKTATTFTTSRARPCERSPLRSSSSSNGAPGHPFCCPRKSRSRCARTCASTAGRLSKRTPTAGHLRIWRWSRPVGRCSTSGTAGEMMSRGSLPRSGQALACRRIPTQHFSRKRPGKCKARAGTRKGRLRRLSRMYWKRTRRFSHRAGVFERAWGWMGRQGYESHWQKMKGIYPPSRGLAFVQNLKCWNGG